MPKLNDSIGIIMRHGNEDQEVCQAFGQLLNTINILRTIEENIKNQNNSALEKCKIEVEYLLNIARATDDISS